MIPDLSPPDGDSDFYSVQAADPETAAVRTPAPVLRRRRSRPVRDSEDACQHAPSVPAQKTRPPKKIGHPGNKMPESGVQECTAPRVAPLSTGAAISGSEHST